MQDQIQTINQIILNLESLPGSAIKALEVSELKNLICHLNEKAIKLDELCESSSEWTNLKQFLNDAIVLLAKFERHSVFENINYEATEPAIKGGTFANKPYSLVQLNCKIQNLFSCF